MVDQDQQYDLFLPPPPTNHSATMKPQHQQQQQHLGSQYSRDPSFASDQPEGIQQQQEK